MDKGIVIEIGVYFFFQTFKLSRQSTMIFNDNNDMRPLSILIYKSLLTKNVE